jgi:hypothetical protein
MECIVVDGSPDRGCATAQGPLSWFGLTRYVGLDGRGTCSPSWTCLIEVVLLPGPRGPSILAHFGCIELDG